MEAPQGGVMTIDAAGITGWAYGPTSWVMPWFGDWVLPFDGGEGCKFAAFENELIDACEQFLPEKIVLEAPINMPAMTNRAATNTKTRNGQRDLRQRHQSGRPDL